MITTKQKVKRFLTTSLTFAVMATSIFVDAGSVFADNDTVGTESYSGKEINRILKNLAYQGEYGNPVSEIDYLANDNIIEKIEWSDSVPEGVNTVSLSSNGRLLAWYMSAEDLAEQDAKEKNKTEEESIAEGATSDNEANTSDVEQEAENALTEEFVEEEQSSAVIDEIATIDANLETESETNPEPETELSEAYYNTIFLYFNSDTSSEGLLARYNIDMSYAFSGMLALTDISGLQYINTGKVEDMSYMFSGDTSLEDIAPVASFVTSSLENVSGLFKDCRNLTDASALNENQTYNSHNVEENIDGNDVSTEDDENYTTWNISNSLNSLFIFDGTAVTTYPDWYQEILDDIASETSDLEFSSKRLIAITSDNSLMQNFTGVISSYDDTYILQYSTEEETKAVYSYLINKEVFVEPDIKIIINPSSDAPFDYTMDEKNNPISVLQNSVESGTGVYDIALIDTGATISNIYSAVSLIDNNPSDSNGHGTQMAEMIVQQTPNATVLSVKAFDENGGAYVSAIYAALRYVMTQDVKVVVMPDEVFLGSAILEQLKSRAVAADITFVDSASDMSTLTDILGYDQTNEETIALDADETETTANEVETVIEETEAETSISIIEEAESPVEVETEFVNEETIELIQENETQNSVSETQLGTVQLVKSANTAVGHISLSLSDSNTSITNDNNCYSLEGAVYGVYTDKECTEKVGELVTNLDGKAISNDLALGSYYIKEITPPTGYEPDDTVYTIVVKDVAIAFNKAATYTVYKGTIAVDNLICDAETGISNTLTLDAGTYTLTETMPAAGYKQNYDSYEFTVTDNEKTYLTENNTALLSGVQDKEVAASLDIVKKPKLTSESILLNKRDGNTTEPIEGAVFKVEFFGNYKTGGSALRTWYYRTDENGVINLTDTKYLFTSGIYQSDLLYYNTGSIAFPLGSVKVTEVVIPEGYALSSNVITGKVTSSDDGAKFIWINNDQTDAAQDNITTSYSNEKYTELTIIGKNSDGGKINNAEFEVYNSDRTDKRTIVIDDMCKDGAVAVNNLTEGLWYIKETKFPEAVMDELKAVLVERTESGDLVIYEYSLADNKKIGSQINSITFSGISNIGISIHVTDSETTSTSGVSDLFPSGTEFMIYEWSEIRQDYGELTECQYKKDFSSGTLNIVNGIDFYDVATHDVLKLHWSEDNHGKFTILETSAADGYVADSTMLELVISKDGKSYILGGEEQKLENENIEITFENTPNQYVIQNVDENGEVLPAATFTYKRTYTNEKGKAITTEEITVKDGVKSARTESGSDGFGDYIEADNGYIVLRGLGTGTYEYWESDAPEGYDVNVTHYIFTVDENGKIAGNAYAIGPTVTNPKENEFYYAITKTADGSPLSGINFEISYGSTTQVYTTNSNGVIDLTSLLKKCFNSGIRTVQFRESQAQTLLPYGVVPADESWTTITLMGDTSLTKSVTKNNTCFTDSVVSYQYEAKSETNKVRIKSVNTNNRAMSGMVFLLTSPSGEEYRLITGKNGFTDYITRLENGVWTYKVVSVPDGYVVDSEEKTFTVDMETHLVNGVAEKDIITTSVYNNLTISAVDEDSETPIKGISYRWSNVNDTDDTIQYTTDDNGQFVINKIADGTYVLTEVTTTEGYISNDYLTFEVKGGHIYCGGEDITDVSTGKALKTLLHKKWDLRIIRTDADNNNLPGAIFSINGEIFNSTGNDTYKKLNAGTYIVQEIQAPLSGVPFKEGAVFIISSQGAASTVSPNITVDKQNNEIVLKISD